jgi:hypothetical protein
LVAPFARGRHCRDCREPFASGAITRFIASPFVRRQQVSRFAQPAV